MSQIEVMKTTGILDVFRGFQSKKLRQKIRRFAKEEFLEVPNHLSRIPCLPGFEEGGSAYSETEGVIPFRYLALEIG